MRKIISLVLLTCLTIGLAQAQYRRPGMSSANDNYHFFYFSGGVGYNTMLTNDKMLTSKGGVGGLIGLGYEFRINGFWMSVGPQLSMSNHQLTIEQTTWEPKKTDPRYKDEKFYDGQGYPLYEGKEISPRYDIRQQDEVKWTYLDIPVMIGYFSHGFYLGAGVKFSYALSSNVASKGDYIFSAQYVLYGPNSPYIEVGHGYGKYDFNNPSEKIKTVPGASMLGEIGYDVLSTVNQHGTINHLLKIGFYLEYGLISMIKEPAYDNRFAFDTKDAQGSYDLRYPTIHPYFQGAMESRRAAPFFTGLKVTYMIGSSRNARNGFHRGCQCYN